MRDQRAVVNMAAADRTLFDHLSQVANLPDHFARMTSARPGHYGEEAHTSARTPDEQQVEGDAWFRTDPDTRRIEWGSGGGGSSTSRTRPVEPCAETTHSPRDSVTTSPTETSDQPDGGQPVAEPDKDCDRDIFPTVYRSARDAVDVEELAQAERAVARHAATPDQIAGVGEAGQERRAEDRLERWRGR